MNESATSPLRLKEWLILQIDSGKYPGLRWENEEKTKFRIPWKHAAKHNYNEEEDAALFKAWAMHKGKFKEGSTKEDPSVWKTRLRCALNKSPDFQEVMENCQDFGEPYKLYRIVYEPQDKSQEGSKEAAKSLHKDEPPRIIMIKAKNQMKEIPLTHGSSEHLQLKHPVEGGSFPSPVIIRTPNIDHKVADISEKAIIIPPSSSSSELQMYLTNKGPEPQYQIQLCFGEEYPGLPLSSKMILTAHVEPVFARELLINAKTNLRKNPPAH
ncbi:hypothetical protein GDO81_013553 [Engystomops pustulosus]|uniref:IRF tryptophan pentad repeat domain-containing protein n=1 Tax=Engystomops pustulosus TaxID=76066 RepID=A0AAV7B4C8_ENGPU|nr:hypothetical protein GDO81_013553 [Engystomops pustulosus]KAG8567262.1 hypothetical protein GDO81_013553 [Engystomops pustulosus]KAG8567263.1 hypothetical protein GDO81_013553 [Engystomops pustulosus]KAG8567264.1 hypothetical protein GDO81_013553 [Engystomops pustulosus]